MVRNKYSDNQFLATLKLVDHNPLSMYNLNHGLELTIKMVQKIADEISFNQFSTLYKLCGTTSENTYRRRIHGLTIKGKCKNEGCIAFGKSVYTKFGVPYIFYEGNIYFGWVCHLQKITTFFLDSRYCEPTCEYCKKPYQPEFFFLNHCQFRFIQQNSDHSFQTDWYRFEGENANPNSFKQTGLTIEVRGYSAEESKRFSITDSARCGICLQNKSPIEDISKFSGACSQDVKIASCGHSFHIRCLESWPDSRNCPTCECIISNLEENNTCSICLDILAPTPPDQPQTKRSAQKLDCGHTFHKICADKWFEECTKNEYQLPPSCPFCRALV